MELILKHLDGSQQYNFLQMLLGPVIGNSEELPRIIQNIMNEVNKK